MEREIVDRSKKNKTYNVNHNTSLLFYGLKVYFSSTSNESVSLLQHDFSFFIDRKNNYAENFDLKILFELKSPSYFDLPYLEMGSVSPRNITYKKGDDVYFDYFGNALVFWNRKKRHFTIHSTQINLVREIVYLIVLAQTSELLEEKKSLHRVHALGLSFKKKGVLICMPSGGGKTTLALSLLNDPGFSGKIISEDSPLLDSLGNLYPFPLRIGVHPDKLPKDIPSEFVRKFYRTELDSKLTINMSFFKNKIETEKTPCSVLLLGMRTTGKNACIEKVSKLYIVKYLFFSSVLGVGLYQGIEFLLNNNLRSSLIRFKEVLKRIKSNLILLKNSKVYLYKTSYNKESNTKVLLGFLENEL